MSNEEAQANAAGGQSVLTDGLGVTRAKHRAQWAEFLRTAARETRETGRVYALIADYECNLIAAHLEEDDGWKEAAIAWEVCASIHEKWAKGKDALYSTRHADFVKHADDARARLTTPN